MKEYHCSKCGIKLNITRKALTGEGRGLILNLIDPHECEGFAIKSNDGENPTVKDIIDNLKPIAKEKRKIIEKEDFNDLLNLKDKREGTKTSTAPTGILDNIKNI